jgi:alpha-L-fucosidase
MSSPEYNIESPYDQPFDLPIDEKIQFQEQVLMHVEEYAYPSDYEVIQRLQEWQNWKFGVIIHWGPYSQWGIVESWSLCPEDEPWCVRQGPNADNYCEYVNAYKQIRKSFNPDKFNPEKWAKACSNAGMKYLVFTTKHHDGFCMFDSKYTNYKITDKESLFSQNPKSNITKEVFSAFRAQGLGIGVYFSKPDWHNEDYWWPYFPVFDRNVNYDPTKYPERWKRFQDYTYNQIEELMTNYGNVDVLWLDGGWVRPAGTLTEETKPWLGKNQWIQDVNMPAIATMARTHQPGLLIVDRTVHGEFENYRTPEQQIPESILSYPWESCITLGDNWYSTSPKERYKSATWAIHTLIKIVAKGGNFLLGIGPDKTGDLVPEVYQRLEEIGKWMKINSAAIYNSKPLPPYEMNKFYFTQSKDEKQKFAFYLLNENETTPKTIELTRNFVENYKEVYLLGYPKMISIKRNKGEIYIEIPEDITKELENAPALVFRISD